MFPAYVKNDNSAQSLAFAFDMKDYAKILHSLKLYLEYLKQDNSCNTSVLQYVEREIKKIEQSGC